MKIAINGHLVDAVYKSCVLLGGAPRSVELIISPECTTLVDVFWRFPSVRSIEIDEGIEYRASYGEQSCWSVCIDLDTTYPRYPEGWIVDFVADYCKIPRLSKGRWFGALSLPPAANQKKGYCFLGKVASRLEWIKSAIHSYGGTCIEWRDDLSILSNVAAARDCEWRFVEFNEEAALMSIFGLECFVDSTKRNLGRYAEIFRCPGNILTDSIGALLPITRRLRAMGELNGCVQNSPVRITIGIPTICCSDLLTQSVPALAEQLSAEDRIVILDNGQQRGLCSLSCVNRVTVLAMAWNVGVAGGWNRLIRHAFETDSDCEWILLLNDDIALASGQLDAIRDVLGLAGSAGKWIITGPYYWSVLAVHRDCIRSVGYFDEQFFPAYFEDNDYHYRLKLIDETRYLPVGEELSPSEKRNSVSIARVPGLNRFASNRERYVAKWGGMPGGETYKTPFGASGRVNARVVAISLCFNQRTVLPSHVAHILQQGIEVHVIDCGSNDGSTEWLNQNGVPFVVETDCGKDFVKAVLRIAEGSGAEWIVIAHAGEFILHPTGLQGLIKRAYQPGISAISLKRFNVMKCSQGAIRGFPIGACFSASESVNDKCEVEIVRISQISNGNQAIEACQVYRDEDGCVLDYACCGMIDQRRDICFATASLKSNLCADEITQRQTISKPEYPGIDVRSTKFAPLIYGAISAIKHGVSSFFPEDYISGGESFDGV